MIVVATLAMHETSITTQTMVRFWERLGDILSNWFRVLRRCFARKFVGIWPGDHRSIDLIRFRRIKYLARNGRTPRIHFIRRKGTKSGARIELFFSDNYPSETKYRLARWDHGAMGTRSPQRIQIPWPWVDWGPTRDRPTPSAPQAQGGRRPLASSFVRTCMYLFDSLWIPYLTELGSGFGVCVGGLVIAITGVAP